MNIFKRNKYLYIEFDDGKSYTTEDCTEELWRTLSDNIDDEEYVKSLFITPELYTAEEIKERVLNSDILTLRGNSVYMLDVSELSIPEDFVIKILEAENAEDYDTLNKFKNFWTLVSLNPDSRVRNNLFWFIRKWDIQISNSGFIIAYRNADIKSEHTFSTTEAKNIINAYYEEKYLNNRDPFTIEYKCLKCSDNNKSLGELYNEVVNSDGSPVYTDHYSHTTEIKLGHPVRIPREECDSEQEHSCSRGLHVASKGWLKENYFGGVGLQVLVNPAKVVAVPTIDEYGKMRTCEYFPVAIVDFDSEGDVIEPSYNLYNDVLYLQELKHEGEINNEDIDKYELTNTFSTREELYESILCRLNEENQCP